MDKRYGILGSMNAFLAVALGAFGAHALKEKISSEMLIVYQTANQYHMIHAIALLITAVAIDKFNHDRKLRWVGRLFGLGIVIFSGSLYMLSISGVRLLGAITPIGGICFLAGWLVMAIALWRKAN